VGYSALPLYTHATAAARLGKLLTTSGLEATQEVAAAIKFAVVLHWGSRVLVAHARAAGLTLFCLYAAGNEPTAVKVLAGLPDDADTDTEFVDVMRIWQAIVVGGCCLEQSSGRCGQ
jgi:hypothetical protein